MILIIPISFHSVTQYPSRSSYSTSWFLSLEGTQKFLHQEENPICSNFFSDMEDGESLLDIKTSPWNYFKRLIIIKNSIWPFLGFLLLLSCLIFIFPSFLESGKLIVEGYIFLCIIYYRWTLPNTVEELQQVLLQAGGELH